MGLMILGCGVGGMAAVLTLLLGGGVLLAFAIYSGVGACSAFGGVWTVKLRDQHARLNRPVFTGNVVEFSS